MSCSGSSGFHVTLARDLGREPTIDSDPEDSWECHFAGTVHEGHFLGHSRLVEIMARESPARMPLRSTGWESGRAAVRRATSP